MDKWFNIQANAGTLRIEIEGEIGGYGVTAKDFIRTVSESNAKSIDMIVSSFGGDVNEAFQIYDYLKSFKGKTFAKIAGFTASAGTLISMAADEVEISANAQFLIHNSWTVAMGNAMDLRATAEDLEKVDNRQVKIYTAKTGMTDEDTRALMAEEKWLDADEAKEKGFVNTVVDYTEISAESLEVIYAKIEAKELPDTNFKHIDKSEEMAENKIIEAINAKFEEVKASLEGLFGTKEEPVETIAKAEAEALVETALNELKVNTEFEISEKNDEIEAKAEEIVALNAKLEEAKAIEAKVVELEEELAKAKAGKVETPKAEEEGSVETPKTEALEGFDLLAAKLKK